MEYISEELQVVKKLFIRLVVVSSIIFAMQFVLTFTHKEFWGQSVPVLIPGSPTLATQVFLSAKAFLVPEGVPVVVLGPVSAFMAPIIMAILITVMAVFPYALFLVVWFLRPALRSREQRVMLQVILPSLILFYLGVALAYFFIIPKTFTLLYSFATPMGVASYFALDDFISSVFLLTLSVGATFLLPVVMVSIAFLGIVPRGFWLKHWRGAVVASLLFSAIVTPDGSGMTMAFLSVPLLSLYGIGAMIQPAPLPHNDILEL